MNFLKGETGLFMDRFISLYTVDYFGMDHNTLCCVACIFECNVYDINDIYNEKKKNLSNNIKNLSNLFQTLIIELVKIMKEIDQNKENVIRKD